MSTPFKILHADDDRIGRLMLAHHASNELDCEVTSVHSGLEAWRLLRDGLSPDLCIFDIMMPGLSGLALLSQMRGDPRFANMPVILCTASRDRASVEAAAGLGVSYYMLKPYNEASVREQILKVRQAQAAVGESAATICARLGLDSVIGQELLTRFAQEINDVVRVGEKTSAMLETGTCDAALTHLNRLKSIAKILCISSVLLEVARLEKSLTSFFSEGEDGDALGLLSMGRQEEWRFEYSTAVSPCLARLKQTADRLIAPPQTRIAAIAEATHTTSLNPAMGVEARATA